MIGYKLLIGNASKMKSFTDELLVILPPTPTFFWENKFALKFSFALFSTKKSKLTTVFMMFTVV